MGREYCGIVEEVGSAVATIEPGQFVGSFFASDKTCPHCQAGYQSSCRHKEFVGTAQAMLLTWSPACSRCPMSWARAGSPP
jgi:D-arabinose 1-dehydrogenase-like Zn-dependent alcohol dehydrogenase